MGFFPNFEVNQSEIRSKYPLVETELRFAVLARLMMDDLFTDLIESGNFG